METFKAKIFKLGHSVAVYLPKSIYEKLNLGQEYVFNVYTNENNMNKVYTEIEENIPKNIPEETITPDESTIRSNEFKTKA